MAKDWIQKAIKKPGALRKAAGVKKGKKIPAQTLHKLAKSSNPTTRKRANLAKTLRGFSDGGEIKNGQRKPPDKAGMTVVGKSTPRAMSGLPPKTTTKVVQADVSKRADGIAQRGRTKGRHT